MAASVASGASTASSPTGCTASSVVVAAASSAAGTGSLPSVATVLSVSVADESRKLGNSARFGSGVLFMMLALPRVGDRQLAWAG